MQWRRINWEFILLTILGIIGIILIGHLIRVLLPLKEGFLALKFNVDKYNPKEIFLVAPNARGSSTYVNIYKPVEDYSNGYTWAQAQAACQAFGAELAPLGLAPSSEKPVCGTNLDLNCAKFLGANWCAAGWTANDTINAYYSIGFNGACGPTSKPGIGRTVPPNGLAFAICIGPKPIEPTLNVWGFNDTRYSMFDDLSMNKVMVGDEDSNGVLVDIFPKTFTRSEATYALEKSRYNSTDARKYLITEYGKDEMLAGPGLDSQNIPTHPVNKNILNSVDPDYKTSVPSIDPTRSTSTESCSQLTGIYNKFTGQIQTLQNLLRDLSGNVIATEALKQQNMYIQNSIQTICQNAPQDPKITSQACARLASLDFDILYRNTSTNPALQSNLIVDLETLNLTLRMRECELIAPLGGLQQVMGLLGCSGYDTTKFGNNLDVLGNGREIRCDTDLSKYPNGTPPKAAFTIEGGNIEQNDVEGLKFALQQISPYYNSSQFAGLLSDVLEQLSILLRTPLITDYDDSTALYKIISKEIMLIQDAFPKINPIFVIQ